MDLLKAFAEVLGFFLLFAALYYFKVVLHELGHLCGCLLVGWKPLSIKFGTGKSITVLQLGDLTVQMGVRLLSGMVAGIAVRRGWFRMKYLFWIACGPGVNVGLILATHALLDWTDRTGAFQSVQTWMMMFFFWQIYVAVFGLFPRMVKIDGQKIPNDGLSIWRTLTMSRQEASKQFFVHCCILAKLRIEQGRYEEAEAALRRGISPPMGELDVKQTMIFLLFSTGKIEGARAEMTNLYNNAAAYNKPRAEILDYLACVPLRHQIPGMFDEAMGYIEQALAEAPGMLTLKTTKGELLIEKNSLSEGMQLLEEVMSKAERKHDQAICRYYMALAHHKKGDADLAREWLDKARDFDPACCVRKRVEDELNAAQKQQAAA